MNEPRIVDEFTINPLRAIGKITVGDLQEFGIYPYWRCPIFYSRLTSLARMRLRNAFPFNIFRNLHVETDTDLKAVLYRNIQGRNTSHTAHSIRRMVIPGPAPLHIEATFDDLAELVYDAFDGTFTVVFECKIDSSKAEGMQILARDNELAHRLKQIMSETYRDNVHTQIGKILLAFGTHQQASFGYQDHHPFPYQTPMPLLDALGGQFKTVLDAIKNIPTTPINQTTSPSASSHAPSTSPSTTDTPVAVPVNPRKRKRGGKVQIVAKMSTGQSQMKNAQTVDATTQSDAVNPKTRKTTDTSKPKSYLANRLGPKVDAKPSVNTRPDPIRTSDNARRTKKPNGPTTQSGMGSQQVSATSKKPIPSPSRSSQAAPTGPSQTGDPF